MPVPLFRFVVLIALIVSLFPGSPEELVVRELKVEVSPQALEEIDVGQYTLRAFRYDVDETMLNSRLIRRYSLLVSYLDRKVLLFHIQRRFNEEWLVSPGEVPQYGDWRLEEELDDGEIEVHNVYPQYRAHLFDFPAYISALDQVKQIVRAKGAGR